MVVPPSQRQYELRCLAPHPEHTCYPKMLPHQSLLLCQLMSELWGTLHSVVVLIALLMLVIFGKPRVSARFWINSGCEEEGNYFA